MIKNKIKEYLLNEDVDLETESKFFSSYYSVGHWWVDRYSIDWEGIYQLRIDTILNNLDVYIDRPCGLSDEKIIKAIKKYIEKLSQEYKLGV